mgnify:CR=1 FL=1
MRCPYCGSKRTQVVDKRDRLDTTRRRRECLKCKKRFTTYERIEEVNLIIIKKDLRREPFNREKLKGGIIKACEKRPVSIEKIGIIVNDIENQLRNQKTTEIKSGFIGELVMKRLKKVDKIAYIRFASVYREFTDIASFHKEIKDLIKGSK